MKEASLITYEPNPTIPDQLAWYGIVPVLKGAVLRNSTLNRNFIAEYSNERGIWDKGGFGASYSVLIPMSLALTEIPPEEEGKGKKNDSLKPPLSLIPTAPLIEIARVLDFGKQKYAAHNWRKGIEQSRLISAALRHISANNEGENRDEESSLNHLAHACCCLLFALEQQLKPEIYERFDDRYIPTREGEENAPN